MIHSTVIHPEGSVPVVFLHGLFGRGKNFTGVAGALAPEARSLLVDLPNHGQSAWTEHLDYPLIADLVADHLRAGFAAHGQVDVVGHSMGGKVAMVLALRHPDLVRKLAVLDISPAAGGRTRGTFPYLIDSLASLDLASVQRRSEANEALRERIPQDAVRGFLLQNLRQGDDGFRWEPNLALIDAELDTVMGFPNVGDATFEGQVLWLGGERSDYIADEDEPVMRSLFPRTRRMTVKGAGHWVHSDAPDVVIGALREFLLA